ncbi:hypothetical protein ABZV31_10630 [Streptomyces sp. NPDC005202]|uniref:hypothetical protein n=1 Tax=Streptomyces sp. NPDC005202 TaxID=3157021 RepID=UPI0033BA11A7
MISRALLCTAAGAALFLSRALAPSAAADDDGNLTAKQLADQADDNLRHATSMHLKFADHSAGVATDAKKPTSMDLSLDRDGNCAGTLRMASNGGTVEIVKRVDQVWMKPDAAFWKAQLPGGQGDAAAELYKNRYIHGTTNDKLLEDVSGLCEMTTYQQQPDGGGDLTKGAETTLDGTKVIPLTGQRDDGTRTTLYVTSSSPHRLYATTEKGGGTDRIVTYTDYDKPVPTKTPSPGESVDIGKLEQLLNQ